MKVPHAFAASLWTVRLFCERDAVRPRVCAGCHTARLEGRVPRQRKCFDGSNQEEKITRCTTRRRRSNPSGPQGDAWIGSLRLQWCGHAFAISRHVSPEVLQFRCPPLERGRREDRVHAAPAVSRANAHGKSAHEHTGSAGASRPSLRNGFTAYIELSPVHGSFATVARERRASRELDASTAASGPHDFAVRDRPHSSVMTFASTTSHRAFVTMVNAPHLPWDARS